MEEITREELEEMRRNCEPDDSVSVPQYEGVSPDEAAGIAKRLSKKFGEMSEEEQRQYEVMQDIADKEGILPDDVDEDNCTRKDVDHA